MHTINTLRIDNCAFAFIDHQPFVAFPIRSIAPDELLNNVSGLAKVARALAIPTVLTSIGAEGGPLADPLFTQLTAVFPDAPVRAAVRCNGHRRSRCFCTGCRDDRREREAQRAHHCHVHKGTARPRTLSRATGPKYRPSNDADTAGASGNTAPARRRRQPVHIGNGR